MSEMVNKWPKQVKTIIFDLDGTLVDTEKLYNRFWVEAARYYGYPMEPKHALMLRSLTHEIAAPLMQKEVCPEFDFFKVRERRRQIMEAYVDEHGVEPKPGLQDTLRRLKAINMKIGLATATQEWRARKYLERLSVWQYFDAVSTAEMVSRGKPAPDIYLLALEKLECKPENAAAVEDSPTGILSAEASGAMAIMIPDMDSPDENIIQHCSMILNKLSDIADLAEVTFGR